MLEFILWGTNPNTNMEQPISEKVYNKEEHNRRIAKAKENGWINLRTQIIDLNQTPNFNTIFKNTINI